LTLGAESHTLRGVVRVHFDGMTDSLAAAALTGIDIHSSAISRDVLIAAALRGAGITGPRPAVHVADAQGGWPRAIADAVHHIVRGAGETAVVIARDAAGASASLVLEHPARAGERSMARVIAAAGASLPALCARAAIDPRTLGLVALHADDADTAVGLRDELARAVERDEHALPRCAIAAIRSAASPFDAVRDLCGLAGAVRDRCLPAIEPGIEAFIAWPLCAHRTAKPWMDRVRRAALWARSGDDVAVIVEGIRSGGRAMSPAPPRAWGKELVLLSGESRPALVARLETVLQDLASGATLRELSARSSATRAERFRAAIAASDPDDLARKATRLLASLERPDTHALHTPDGVSFGDAAAARGSTAMMFPGQGAQYLGMLADLCLDIRAVQGWFEQLHDSYPESEYCPPAMLIAPPELGLRDRDRQVLTRSLHGVSRGAMATLISCLAMHDVLARAGVRAGAMAGYSNGENAALVASGAWRLSGLDELFALLHIVRAKDETENVERGVCMAVTHAPAAALREALDAAGGVVHLALENCPEQVVLFGPAAPMAHTVERLRAHGAMCVEMAFDRGHHTPLYASTVAWFRPQYDLLDIRAPRLPLYSCVEAGLFPTDPTAIRDLAARQWAQTVRFGDTVARMYDDGVRTFVEVGPGAMLTGFVRSTLKGRPHAALPSNIAGRPALDQLLLVLGRLFVSGHDVDVSGLWRDAPARDAAPAGGDQPPGPTPASTAEPDRRDLIPASSAEPERPGLTPTAQPPIAADIVERHFALMRTFLDVQQRSHARVMAALTQPPAPPPVVPQQPARPEPVNAWPMLPPALEITGQTLRGTRVFTVREDTFLRHHTIGPVTPDGGATRGLAVVPLAFSLELAIEAAQRLTGASPSIISVRHVRATRWLALDEPSLDVHIDADATADRTSRREVRVRLRDATPAATPAFEAIIAVDGPWRESERLAPVQALVPPRALTDAFNRQLFHGPALRCLGPIRALEPFAIETSGRVPDPAAYFAGCAAPALRTPVALIDAASQLVALWWIQDDDTTFGAFPFQIDAYEQYAPPPKAGEAVTFRARLQRSGRVAVADLEILGADGARVARLSGLRARIFEFPRRYFDYVFRNPDATLLSDPEPRGTGRVIAPLPAELVDGGRSIWLRVLAAVALSDAERRLWLGLPGDQRAPWLLRHIAATEAALETTK
jgi:malonyl CoA-acyl carrier protein transacylase